MIPDLNAEKPDDFSSSRDSCQFPYTPFGPSPPFHDTITQRRARTGMAGVNLTLSPGSGLPILF